LRLLHLSGAECDPTGRKRSVSSPSLAYASLCLTEKRLNLTTHCSAPVSSSRPPSWSWPAYHLSSRKDCASTSLPTTSADRHSATAAAACWCRGWAVTASELVLRWVDVG
jgi:hypothetical protein